ncbi:MAG TPA: hypothetical protein PKD09_05310 [Aggregatilinea sp.]|uniref:hypothetical protein n=1 Tax=Aggregatilinea sp. TaxID=2806333 RepID=UPI002C06362B|nr:hypothetical protein [Aggregatilinea sp.]HML21044.1 hypothetical protein [Aggregatilinea sp.]
MSERAKPAPKWLAALVGIVLLAAGCGGDDATPGPVPTRTLVPPTATLTPLPLPSQATLPPTATDLPSALAIGVTPTPVNVLEIPADAEAFILQAMDDLASAGSVDRKDIRLLSVEAFTWPDTALGCASRGAGTTDVSSAIIPGYRILLSTGNRIVVYHTDREDTIFECDDPGWLAQEGKPLPIDPVAGSMAELVTHDAAQRLGVPDAQIDLVGLLAVDWPDTSLGCPKTDVTYDEVITPGYRIVLRGAAQSLIYHTNIRDFVLCAPEDEILPEILSDALPIPAPDATAEISGQ